MYVVHTYTVKSIAAAASDPTMSPNVGGGRATTSFGSKKKMTSDLG